MTYQEAIAEIQKYLTKTYIGFIFRSGHTGGSSYFGYYEISVPDLEDPEWISISYEGGYLFSSCGEDGSYSLEDVPEEAKTLRYRSVEGLPYILGDCSEYALFKLFPELPDPEDLWTAKEKLAFAKLAADRVQKIR